MNKRLVTKKSIIALAVIVLCILGTAVVSGGLLSGCSNAVPASQETTEPPVSASTVAAVDTTPVAAAPETSNSEDTPGKIYVLDENGEAIQIDVNKKRFIFGDSISTQLDDQAISELVGLKIILPEALNDEFTLWDKFIGVSAGKREGYTSLGKLDFRKAIMDDSAFNELSAYNPYRYCSAHYQSSKGFVSIAIYKDDRNNEDFSAFYSGKNSVDVNIGTIKGSWRSCKLPVYSKKTVKTVNGQAEFDMTKPPTKVETHYDLTWTSNGVLYSLFLINQITQQEAVDFAKAFMAAQGD